MNVILFNTEAEAETKQASFLLDHLAAHNDEPYATQTTKWDIPKLRNDGKWSIAECEHSDLTCLTIVPYDIADYPAEV